MPSTAFGEPKLCAFARPNKGSYAFSEITSGEFQWGHALLVHIDVNGELTYLGSPEGIHTKTLAAVNLYGFLAKEGVDKVGVCYTLTSEQEEQYQNLMVGALLEELRSNIQSWSGTGKNCTWFAEDVFEKVTGENLLVRGVQHVGVASPNILARRIFNDMHAFQADSDALNLKTATDIADFLSTSFAADPSWTDESKDEYVKAFRDYKSDLKEK